MSPAPLSPADRFEQLAERMPVWLATTLPVAGAERDQLEQLLSPDERARHRRYLRTGDQDLFLRSHATVRMVLSMYASIEPADWTFALGEHGRPEVTNGAGPKGLRFNLSHTNGLIAVAVNRDVDAGVDVERIGRVDDLMSVARTSFSPDEFASFSALPTQQREAAFYRLWTLKEAFIKATGRGLATGLKRFSFDVTDPAHIGFTCDSDVDAEPGAWTFTTHAPSDTHVVSTACRVGAGMPPRPVDLLLRVWSDQTRKTNNTKRTKRT